MVVTILAGFVTQRGVRRFGALAEEHAALEESKARELEMFAARAAHDILNPVAAVQMSLDLAQKRDIEDARARELLARAQRSLLRIRSIVGGLLQFARAGAKPEPHASVDVAAVIEDVAAGIRPAAEGAGIDLRVDGIPPSWVRCDAGVLTSIVSNLTQNAMKYMGDTGVRRITLRAAVHDCVVHVEVEDTGPGIPPESEDAIFLPYVRGTHPRERGPGSGPRDREASVRGAWRAGRGPVRRERWLRLGVLDRAPAVDRPPLAGR